MKALRLQAGPVAAGIYRLRLTDAERQRWEVPTELFASDILNPPAESAPPAAEFSEQDVEVQWDEDPFALRVIRRGDGLSLLDTSGLRLVYKDQYVELTTWVHPDATLFGAGERPSEALHLARNGFPLTLWNQDVGPSFLQHNSYGSHPFVLALMPGTMHYARWRMRACANYYIQLD